jgi:branched-chain amino acid aminotransferase
MAHILEYAYFDNGIVPFAEANVSVASAAVLYGLSVYTVFPICHTSKGLAAFRLIDHYTRLVNSARIIGLDTFERVWTIQKFEHAVRALVTANTPQATVFARVTVHADVLLPGTRSRGLSTRLSMFLYEAVPILPSHGVRLKTSVWRRIPDFAIPSRAKVNGAYINSVLAKQDALDSGYDDCIFLDVHGHVCELSAANLFLVRQGMLLTPNTSSDLLEGITRQTVFELARAAGITVVERMVDLTELYIADEVFACGTSAFVASVQEIDGRTIGTGTVGPITQQLQDTHQAVMRGSHALSLTYLTLL